MSSAEKEEKSLKALNRSRPGRPKKRRFRGNQRVDENHEKFDDNPGPSSSSKRKLSSDRSTSACNNPNENPNIAYEIINFMTVFGVLSEYVKCKVCGEDVKFSTVGHVGLAFQIKLICQKCKPRYVDSCPKISHNSYDLNTRVAFSMRMLGVGFSGLLKFCGLMDLPNFLSRNAYDRIVKSMRQAASAVAHLSMMRAVNEEVEFTGDEDSIIISRYGSWRKRELHSSQTVVAVVGNFTGKVLDIETKSSCCSECNAWEGRDDTQEYSDWLVEHKEQCALQNREETIDKMEIDATCEIFKRSEERYNIKYKHYVGDGDEKAFLAVQNIQPYGPDFHISKRECVEDVQRRMRNSLREVKNVEKGDCDRGELTDDFIKELTQQYGEAIRNNSTVEGMRNAIWAIFYHKCSTNDTPQHDHCPDESDTWCTWQKAKASGTLAEYQHEPALHADIQEALRPVFDDVSKEELLKKCVGHFAKNSNESFHSFVWKIARKDSYTGIEIVKFAMCTATAMLNDGCVRLLEIMGGLGLQTGLRALQMSKEEDNIRLKDGVDKRERSSAEEKNKLSSTLIWTI